MRMSSLRNLNGVAHSLAHHAQSGLSYLHPHLAEACSAIGVNVATVEVMSQQPYPAGLPASKPLELALGELHQFFSALLQKHHVSPEQVQSCLLTFTFKSATHSPFLCDVACSIATQTGKIFSREVAWPVLYA